MTSIVQTIQHGNLLREGDWRDQSVMDIQKLLKGATIYRASLRRGRTDREPLPFVGPRCWIFSSRLRSGRAECR